MDGIFYKPVFSRGRKIEKYRTLFESMAQGAFWQAANGTLLDINSSALEMFGIPKDEFLSRTSLSPAWKVIAEDDSQMPASQHPSMVALKTGKPVYDSIVKVYNPKENEWKGGDIR